MKTVEKYLGSSYGTPAPGGRISVDTPLAPFQRKKSKAKVTEYINKSKGVDWNLFGYATAVRYPDGRIELINGQHRIDVVRQILPDVKEVPAHIIDLTETQYAATLFDNMNGAASQNLKSEEQFYAQIYAGNKHALMLESILKKTNFSVGKVNESPTNRPIKYANFVKCVRFGSDEFLRAAELVDTIWPKGSVSDNLLSGMSRLFSINEYAPLMDNTCSIGKGFEQWLTNHANNGITQRELEFKKYQNAGPWYDAIAYGLARHYLKVRRAQNKSSINIGVIEKIWSDHTRTKDSDSLFF